MQTPLTLEEVEAFIQLNTYSVSNSNISRCIDGRYEKDKDLPGLSKPGADVGDLLMLCATNRQYNLGVSPETLVDVLINVVGGWKNFQSHTDSHHTGSEDCFFGCGHFNQSFHNPEAFSLAKEDGEFILKTLEEHKNEIHHVVLEGEHMERAVVVVKGNAYAIYPKYEPTEQNRFRTTTEIFVYHKTLDNERRKKLAAALLPHVKIPSITEDYLYQIMSQVSDDQLLTIVERLAARLTLYTVEFKTDGSFEVVE